jgi:hypothetical protein
MARVGAFVGASEPERYKFACFPGLTRRRSADAISYKGPESRQICCVIDLAKRGVLAASGKPIQWVVKPGGG